MVVLSGERRASGADGRRAHRSAERQVEHLRQIQVFDFFFFKFYRLFFTENLRYRFYRQFYLFCCYFVLSVISFTLRPGPDMKDDEPQTTGNDTEPSSSSEPPPPFEVTLSSLLIKTLAEHLNETSDDTLERMTQAMASNISTSLRDTWNLTIKRNYSSENSIPGPFVFNTSGIVLLTKIRSDREIWYLMLIVIYKKILLD